MRTVSRAQFIAALFLSLLLAQAGYEAIAKKSAYDAPLNRFQSAIDAFATQDSRSMPAPGGTVFVGSSTFAHWKTLASDFKDFSAINRGFGGSTMPEVNHYFARLVSKYKPAKVVVYAGTNDIADGHSGERVAADVATFLQKAHEQLPDAQVYFISMSVAPSRQEWTREYVEGNRLIEAMTRKDSKFHFIDVTKIMRDEKGQLHTDYFGPDNLHMNRKGYEAWIPVIRKALTDAGSK
ncbi:MAG: hypothetical protein JSS83_26335 [Cyanobacteria bacterium SZAS LIN-3]|nr:hypothetical protein [Cyanobacteria bacterium SZAS LIN-3]